MIDSVMMWNEPNNLSHWDFELDPDWKIFADMTRMAAEAVRAYLEEHASPRRTARRLGVHENTIKNRVRATEELRGHPANQRVAETLLALRLARIVDEDQA